MTTSGVFTKLDGDDDNITEVTFNLDNDDRAELKALGYVASNYPSKKVETGIQTPNKGKSLVEFYYPIFPAQIPPEDRPSDGMEYDPETGLVSRLRWWDTKQEKWINPSTGKEVKSFLNKIERIT